MIKELENLSDKGVYRRDKLEWWLMKYREDYRLLENDAYSSLSVTYRADASEEYKEKIGFLNKSREFVDTYKVLDEISQFYRSETYFKEEVEVYTNLKNNLYELDDWLEKHKVREGSKYAGFVSMFQNIRALSGYRLDILYPLGLPLKMRLFESDFKYTLKFLEILEMSEKVEIRGIVEVITPLEVIKQKNSQTFKRQYLVVAVNDGHGSKLFIRFVHEKIEHLINIEVGQNVKVYVDILGGENKSDESGYYLTLLGWSVEVLEK